MKTTLHTDCVTTGTEGVVTRSGRFPESCLTAGEVAAPSALVVTDLSLVTFEVAFCELLFARKRSIGDSQFAHSKEKLVDP